MKSKKLTFLFYTYIGIVVIVAMLLMYYQKQQKQKGSTTGKANVISRTDTGDTTDEPIKKSTHVIDVESVLSERQKVYETSESKSTLSYSEVYQDLQSARACQTIYRFWREQGITADVSKRVARPHYFYGQPVYAGTEQPPLTSGQEALLSYWIEQCVQLWINYGEFDNSNTASIPINDVLDAISRKLLEITPKNKKEQKLKQMRQLVAQWLSSYQGLEAAYEGEDTLDSSASQALYDQLERLKDLDEEVKAQWFAAQRNSLPDEEALRDQHFDLLKQIRALEYQIKDQKQVNKESLNQALDNFQGFDQAINEAIKTQYAEVFFEYIYAFNGKQSAFFQYLGFEYVSPINSRQPASQHRISPDQLVYEAAGYENVTMHQWELRYATHLYLCDIGWDCGPKSPIVMNYCLFGLMGSYVDACETDLPNYYQQKFISPNRWPDVMKFKSLYKELFNE